MNYSGPGAQWPPGEERVHMNHWMANKEPPPAAQEIAVDCFWFCPEGGGPCEGRQC
jgi:hypothetical protein